MDSAAEGAVSDDVVSEGAISGGAVSDDAVSVSVVALCREGVEVTSNGADGLGSNELGNELDNDELWETWV